MVENRYHPRRGAPTGCSRGSVDLSAYVGWDVLTWSRALEFWQQVEGDRLTGARVLEVGARDGGLTQWFCDRGAAQVVCSDLGGPSEIARARHRGLIDQGRVQHADVDATDIAFRSCFDIVAFKSVLGGIGGLLGREALNEVIDGSLRCLKPGGSLLFAENLIASPMHTWARRRFTSWGARWLYLTPDDVLGLLEEYATVDWQTTGFLSAFGRSERTRGALARLDGSLMDRLLPPANRYVMYGVARCGPAGWRGEHR